MPTAESPQKTAPDNQEVLDDRKVPSHDDNGFVSRDGWLAQAGRYAEKTITVDGLGKLLIVELSGTARAAIQAQQSKGLLADSKTIDVGAYQRAVLLAGVADPASPTEARLPMFKQGDMDAVMRIGGGKIAKVVEAIEVLSGLDAGAAKRAEENSVGTPSAGGTS
jgi:hypothetical protein